MLLGEQTICGYEFSFYLANDSRETFDNFDVATDGDILEELAFVDEMRSIFCLVDLDLNQAAVNRNNSTDGKDCILCNFI